MIRPIFRLVIVAVFGLGWLASAQDLDLYHDKANWQDAYEQVMTGAADATDESIKVTHAPTGRRPDQIQPDVRLVGRNRHGLVPPETTKVGDNDLQVREIGSDLIDCCGSAMGKS